MKHNQFFCGGTYSISGNLYQLASIFSYGTGLLYGVRRYIFEPINKSLPVLAAVHWKDGEMSRFSRYQK